MKKNCYTIAFCFLNLCKNIKKVFKKGWNILWGRKSQ
jgi:hypothetical protein